MRLPWDKEYIKISFHVILTGIIIGALYLLASHIGAVINGILLLVQTVLSLCVPLIAAFLISYLLDPAVEAAQNRFEKLVPKTSGKSSNARRRTQGVFIVYIALLLLLGALCYMGYRGLSKSSEEAWDLAKNLEAYFMGFDQWIGEMQIKLLEFGLLDNFQVLFSAALNYMNTFIGAWADRLLHILGKAGAILFKLILGFAIAFYFLRDKYAILSKIKELSGLLLSDSKTGRIQNALKDIDRIFSGYLKGQLTDAIIVAGMISVLLTALGIKFPIIIGLLSGISNLVPYFGAIVGFLLAVLMALIEGDMLKTAMVAAGILIIQQIDGMFIVPKVVGENVKLHPAMVLLVLSAAGSLFGITGLILAVPITASFKLFASRFVYRIGYKQGEK